MQRSFVVEGTGTYFFLGCFFAAAGVAAAAAGVAAL